MPISRRLLLSLPAALAASASAAPINYRDYSRCLPDYLARLAREFKTSLLGCYRSFRPHWERATSSG